MSDVATLATKAPARPRVDTTSELWMAHAKLELAARLAHEAAQEIKNLVDPGLAVAINRAGDALERAAPKILGDAVSPLERA